jgi:exopolyphosphatase/guanosine-5'-triphosphate,3'-diphosphate pyrophosphatase
MTQEQLTPTSEDLETLSRQLGRPARDVVEIGARCVCGNPLVATTAPRLSNGIPFPTTYYLAHPVITAAVSRLEAAGVMNEMTERLEQDPELAARYRAAHEAYLQVRNDIGARTGVGPVPEIDGVSAGGMPTRVKCLHVLVGHSLAAGPGVNPLGDEALERISPWWTRDRCYCDGAWDTTAAAPSRDLSRHTKTQGLSAEELDAKRAARREAVEAANAEQQGDAVPDQNEAQEHTATKRVAAVDCGTNSIRLLIADVTYDGGVPKLTDVVRLMRVNRLGQGVDATGRLAPEALERTFEAADEYAALIREHGAEQVRFVATSASRDAENRSEFVDGIRARLGVEPEVITGDEEAALSFAGATSVLGGSNGTKTLVVDLGGGSTEFVLGTSEGVLAAKSTDMGCVRFTERHLTSNPPTEAEIAVARGDILDMIAQVLTTVPLAEAHRLVGVAGTITTVTAHALHLPEYSAEAIHGTELDVARIDQAADELLHMDRDSRAALPYMHPGRVDVIGAGALIWQTIVDRVAELTDGAVSTAVTSEHDILDGIALSAAR